jgi:hypothetical protein
VGLAVLAQMAQAVTASTVQIRFFQQLHQRVVAALVAQTIVPALQVAPAAVAAVQIAQEEVGQQIKALLAAVLLLVRIDLAAAAVQVPLVQVGQQVGMVAMEFHHRLLDLLSPEAAAAAASGEWEVQVPVPEVLEAAPVVSMMLLGHQGPLTQAAVARVVDTQESPASLVAQAVLVSSFFSIRAATPSPILVAA